MKQDYAFGSRNTWRAGMALPGGKWIGKPQVATNTWLIAGRQAAADMLHATVGSSAYRPYNVLGIGTNSTAPDHNQTTLLSEASDGSDPPNLLRVVASTSERIDNLVTIVGEFPAEDYAGLQIIEAALFNDLNGGDALYRVTYGAPIHIVLGQGYVLRVELQILLGA